MTFLRFLGVEEEEGLEMRLFLTAGDEETVYLCISNLLLLLIFYWISGKRTYKTKYLSSAYSLE